MVDLETLGRGAGCAILSIAAVRFSRTGLHEKFYSTVDFDSCSRLGLEIDPETLRWWAQQSPEARAVLRQSLSGTCAPIGAVLAGLQEFLGPDDLIWGHGATFDNAILLYAFETAGMPRPWSYRNDRCFRTLLSLYPNVPWDTFEGIEHHALDDAKAQALHAVKLLDHHAEKTGEILI